MSSVIIVTVVTLALLGSVLAVVLYFVAKKFRVDEDPRIGEVESCLPGANCGGCGYAGCHAFAESCVKANDLDSHFCPVGGNEVMRKVAGKLGIEVVEKAPMVAVVRCSGSCVNRQSPVRYDGLQSCRVKASLFSDSLSCAYGCLGEGDCVGACSFGALSMDRETGLPVVDESRCTACGACVKACPKSVLELRLKGVKSRRVFVSCVNREKGAVARKACKVACIGCGKCAKTCPFGAITVENNLAYIDYNLCRLCRKCVAECPTGAIHAVNFPVPVKTDVPAAPVSSAGEASSAAGLSNDKN